MPAISSRLLTILALSLAALAGGLLVVSTEARATPAPARSQAHGGAPTLGLDTSPHTTQGFGQVRPREINYGGDPTSYVVKIHWSSWGGARAVGHGKADWVWPGWCVACGSDEQPATVVAFNKGTCDGHAAYERVEWFFPSRGMTFDTRLAGGQNLCGGKAFREPRLRETKCGSVKLVSHGRVDGRATKIDEVGYRLACRAARTFVASSGAARYYKKNARFSTDGWWCGSELSMQFKAPPPQDFTCERGDFTTVLFDLSPASR